jgi:Ni/Fe-hydrogenase subunit HybB-like protein
MVTRYAHYMPSPIEFLSGAGIVAYGILAVSLGIRYLNIVNHQPIPEEAHETQLAPAD